MAARAPRWWRFPLYGLGALLALVLLLSLLLQTGLAREQIRQRVNAALAPLFQGKIQIERLDHVGLWGVAGVDARIFDPDGRQVIRAQGLQAHADLPRLGWQLLFGGASPRLTIDRVRIDYADVTLREHEELGVTLASTFEPVDTEEPAAAEDAQGTVELRIPRIELERVWAHGKVAGSPALDADLLELRGELRQGEAGFALELERADVVTRALPGGSEPRGRVWGSIDVPSEQERPLRLEGFLDGRAAGSPLWLETTWVGDDLYAKLSLPRIPADYINGQVSGLALQGELALLAEAHGALPELDLFADVRGSAGHVAVTGNAFLADGLEALLLVSASNVNLAAIAADAPASDLSAQLQALVFEEQDEQFELAHRLDVAAGHLNGVATPPLGVTGRLTLPTTGGLAAWGGWQLAEPGASLGGRYRASLAQERDDFVSISLAGQLSDPPRAALLGIQAAGEVHGEAELWLESEVMKAKLDVSLSRLDYQTGSAPPLQARAVELRAQLAGSIDDPRAHAAATVELLSGRAHADVHYGAHEQEASLFLADIDLHRVAALLGTPLPFEQGNLNADLTVRRQGPSSRPYELNGKLRADLGAAGTVELTATSLKLPSKLEGPLPLASLSGELTANGKLDLARTPRLARMVGFPLERSTGTVRFELTGKRAEGGVPELALLLDTNGLRIIERREPRDEITTTSQAIENKPFALEGIDAHASLRFLPATGELVGTVITRDRGGT
ncbi:MAG TPA: hypothetical protein VEX18_01205, partial [Polyangiaceae bacterium]|nr:hypothetical protein [Polyangiaceae bacterium]